MPGWADVRLGRCDARDQLRVRVRSRLGHAEAAITTMPETNRQLVLRKRPKGLLAAGDLELAESAVPAIQDGQALARVKYLSIDPTMRVWMAHDTYLPVVAIGEVMRAAGLAEVVESRNKEFKKGDKVVGLTGLQDYCV